MGLVVFNVMYVVETDNLTYRIQPNYRTVRIGFSKMLGKLVVKYVPTYTKGTLLKQLRTHQIMLMRCFCRVFFFFFFFLIFFIKHMLWVLI